MSKETICHTKLQHHDIDELISVLQEFKTSGVNYLLFNGEPVDVAQVRLIKETLSDGSECFDISIDTFNADANGDLY